MTAYTELPSEMSPALLCYCLLSQWFPNAGHWRSWSWRRAFLLRALPFIFARNNKEGAHLWTSCNSCMFCRWPVAMLGRGNCCKAEKCECQMVVKLEKEYCRFRYQRSQPAGSPQASLPVTIDQPLDHTKGQPRGTYKPCSDRLPLHSC